MSVEKMMKIIIYVLISVLCIIMVWPFIIMVSVSLQSMKEIYSSDIVLVPEKLLFENYHLALLSGNWLKYFFNSLFITGIVVAISLFINSLTGYSFARIKFRGSSVLFIILLIGLMIPPQVTLVPLFIMFKNFPLAGGNNIFGAGGSGLLDTYAGLIIPFVAGSFGVFLCRQYYLNFPYALDDAAKIDGCGRFKAYLKIYLPLSKPILASLGVLKFTGTWNEYTWPLVLTKSDGLKTVQLGLTIFTQQSEIIWNQLMAMTFLVSIPLILIFIFAQKYFIQGMIAGAVKG